MGRKAKITERHRKVAKALVRGVPATQAFVEGVVIVWSEVCMTLRHKNAAVFVDGKPRRCHEIRMFGRQEDL